jgi:hypothetical protein
MLRAITREASRDDYQFSALLMGVIQSPAFTMNLKTESTESTDVAALASEE